MRFEFATATRILFGPGRLREVAPFARTMGNRALVVTGRTAGRVEPLTCALRAGGISHLAFAVAGEPTTDLVREGAQRAREAACDLVIAFGGGSVMDTGKAIAALLTNQGELLDYLEVIRSPTGSVAKVSRARPGHCPGLGHSPGIWPRVKTWRWPAC